MELHTYLRLLHRQWWLMLASVMVALGTAAFVTVRTPPTYQASVTFFVTIPSQGVTDAYQGSLFLQQRVKSYADLLTSDRLAHAVVAAAPLGLTPEQVRSRIATSTQTGTVLLRATVVDRDSARALKLTETLATQFVDLVRTVETPAGGGDPGIKIEVVSGPTVGVEPVAPRPLRNLSLAGLLGLLAGVGLAFLRELADNRTRDGQTLERETGAPLLGEIPHDTAARTDPLIVGAASRSARAEAVRKLRTNLRFVDVHEPARVITVTSAVQAEGKTTMSCNLAIALAEAGWRVLLVDADLRRPKLADYLGLESGLGLTDVLLGTVSVGDVVQPWGDRSLLVLTAGTIPPNPSELLGSKAMADLLIDLRESADMVIIDTAPLLAVTDAVVVAVQTDGALLVTRQGRTNRSQAAAAARCLHSVSVRVLGCVLNMVKLSRSQAYEYQAYQAAAAEPADTASVPADRATATGVCTTPPQHASDDREPAHADTAATERPQELTRLSR